ncbi:uncharacterized protein LOC136035431 [Artemia franciscana]|uniref:Uncharacterized protein n=1 Tax=Artemia franciscana TaxID=6661 RepID=A0AA88LH57_ARTSF|nr:hypothetical protein QYM36_003712 [Artemia franciscana]
MEEDDQPRTDFELNLFSKRDEYVAPPVLELPSVILPRKPESPRNEILLSQPVLTTPIYNQQLSDNRIDTFLAAIVRQNEQIIHLQEQMASLLFRNQPQNQGSLYFYEEKRVERSIIERTDGTTAQVGVLTNRVVGNAGTEDLKRQLKEEILAELRQCEPNLVLAASTNSPLLSCSDARDVSPKELQNIASNQDDTLRPSTEVDSLLQSTQSPKFQETQKNKCKKYATSASKNNVPKDKVRNPQRGRNISLPSVSNDSQKEGIVKEPKNKFFHSSKNITDNLNYSNQDESAQEEKNENSMLTFADLKLATIDEQTSIVQEPVVVDIEEYETSDSEDETMFKESEKEFGYALDQVKNIIEHKKQVSFGPYENQTFRNNFPKVSSSPNGFRRITHQPRSKPSMPMTPIRKATLERVTELGASFVQRRAQEGNYRDNQRLQLKKDSHSEVSIALARLSNKYNLPSTDTSVRADETDNATSETNFSLSTQQYLQKYGLMN